MDRKRELYKRFLDEKKVFDLLSKLVVSLYELNERPSDPLQYIQDFLAMPQGIDIAQIRAENLRLPKELEEKKEKLEELKKKLESKTAINDS